MMANSKSFQIAQNASLEAKGRQYKAGKVTKRLFNIDQYSYLVILILLQISKLQVQYIYYKITIRFIHKQTVWGPCGYYSGNFGCVPAEDKIVT